MSEKETPSTPAPGPGLFVMGNTTGLPQQQRARRRARRDAREEGGAGDDGGGRDVEPALGAARGGDAGGTGEARREANADADASATSSLLATAASSPFRGAREAETIEEVGGKFMNMCLCRDRECGRSCNRTFAVIVCIFVALAFMATVGSIVAAVSAFPFTFTL